jgi:hypothetical protein
MPLRYTGSMPGNMMIYPMIEYIQDRAYDIKAKFIIAERTNAAGG